jgi:putative FmdB family regulatory protein
MPIYEFFCNTCKKKFSVPRYYSGKDGDIPVCPHCGAKTSQRIYGDVGVIFKGEGFYTTDHRKEENDND